MFCLFPLCVLGLKSLEFLNLHYTKYNHIIKIKFLNMHKKFFFSLKAYNDLFCLFNLVS